MESFIKGMDLSTLLEVEACGGRFTDGGAPEDAMAILRRYGMNLVRLRLWNDPYTPQGEAYGAGTCDLPRVMALARRAKTLGVGWMLDFHYSDFWADPGKQRPPKAWADMTLAQMVCAVRDYTFSVMTVLREANLLPQIVSIGNEITNGLLWPHGHAERFGDLVALLNAGIRAVREAGGGAKVMLHLDDGGNNALYRRWFDGYLAAGGEDFDYIGLSYYPYWHGPLADLRENMRDLAGRYGKPMIVAEVSAGFSLEDYGAYEALPPQKRKGMAANAVTARRSPYAMTPEGQRALIRDVMDAVRGVPGGLGRGFIWWEPAWIPVPGSQWASDAAIAYMREKGPGGNEWANQALFDYEGRALPALEEIRDF